MNLFAEISSGNTDFADVCFLVAVILAVLSTIAAYATNVQATRAAAPLLSAAIAAAALGWLVL